MSRELRRLGEDAVPASAEAEAGRLLHRARELPVPSDQALARVLARVRGQVAARAPLRRWRPAAALGTLLLAGGALAATGTVAYRVLRPEAPVVLPGRVDARPDAGAPSSAPADPPLPADAGAPDRPAVPTPPAPTSPRPTAVARPRSLPAPEPLPPPVAEPDAGLLEAGLDAGAGCDAGAALDAAAVPAAPRSTALAEECRLLDEALRALDRGQAQAALGTLDEHQRRFPSGEMADEVLAARVNALVALGRRGEALATLESLPASVGRGRGLRALRGELLVHQDRCVEAVALLDALLAEASLDDAAERALFARASCRGRMGQFEASAADLRSYLEHFPRGRFAEEARRALRR